jgi:hypothetical protein
MFISNLARLFIGHKKAIERGRERDDILPNKEHNG